MLRVCWGSAVKKVVRNNSVLYPVYVIYIIAIRKVVPQKSGARTIDFAMK